MRSRWLYLVEMSVLKHISIFFICMQPVMGFAQQVQPDTIHPLQTVYVTSAAARTVNAGNKLQVLDSLLLDKYAGNNLGDVLNFESDVYVKSYGLGLATTSIRGGGSNHTAILWNGFNLQNPMYGPQDLSLISVNFLNEILLQYGSSGATWGSGAVGGAIHLNNLPQLKKGVTAAVGASVGSFSDRQEHAMVGWSKKRISTSFKWMNQQAENDFFFRNTKLPEQPEIKLTNASLKQTALMNENYFQINDHQKINARFWYQSSNREIPPSMSQQKGASYQLDESYRITAEWQRTAQKLILLSRAAHFFETLTYDDSVAALHSFTKTKVTILETESKWNISTCHLLNVAVNNTYAEAYNLQTQAYTSPNKITPHQNRLAFIASYKIHNKKNTVHAFLNLRKEFIGPDNRGADTIVYTPFESKPLVTKTARPFTYSIGGDVKLFKKLQLNYNVAQHYRIPTFNDLYWPYAGNINLKSERGWGEEAGITFKNQYGVVSVYLNASVFNRVISNWILWTPSSFGPWTPENIMKVWSRGAEYQVKLDYAFQKFIVQLNLMWNYTVSTNQFAKSEMDGSVGKQLMYTPMYKGNGSLTVGYKTWRLIYNQKYVGYTYTTSDNKKYLHPYLISNLQLSALFGYRQFKWRVWAGINNVFNSNYQVIEDRPMPRINYQVGCSLYFN